MPSAGTAAVIGVSAFSSIVAVAFASSGRYRDGSSALLDMVCLLALTAVAASLIWRRRWPVAICLGASAVALVLPLDAFASLVALTWVYAQARHRTVLLCTGASVVAVAVSLGRDLAREGEAVIFSTTIQETGERFELMPIGYAIIGVLMVAGAVAVGLVRRYRTDARAARDAATAEAKQAAALRSQADHLRTELSRQDERELIAREMHDTVAHHLSLVSLHASVLEVTADDPGVDVGASARSMRGEASRALDEMRTLIAALRTAGDGLAEQYAGPAPRLADLPGLVDDARRAGVDIGATVFVDQGDSAPPALTRAVYRVVQESLTNAMKHGPGGRVDVEVRARPGNGVDVVVHNALAQSQGLGAASSGGTGGAGLIGMRERVEALDGTFSAEAQDGRFVVRAHLPWVGSPV
ncbi:two-component sensor histidine kinase [Cellulomonas soli]|uniref:histidine kinase n=2 Tax=Cellulomonas soli TaxID=931535 RepID=A0A512PE54_9CELL|nr:two-component sensor histidine kinase [Cellulomonas soli]